jgi:hypothetical protein
MAIAAKKPITRVVPLRQPLADGLQRHTSDPPSPTPFVSVLMPTQYVPWKWQYGEQKTNLLGCCMDEGRKRVVGIMAASLASVHMQSADDLFRLITVNRKPLFVPGGSAMQILVPLKPVVFVWGLLSGMILVSFIASSLLEGRDPFAPGATIMHPTDVKIGASRSGRQR